MVPPNGNSVHGHIHIPKPSGARPRGTPSKHPTFRKKGSNWTKLSHPVVCYDVVAQQVIETILSHCYERETDMTVTRDLTRLPSKAKAKMASGQGSRWLIESPKFLIYV